MQTRLKIAGWIFIIMSLIKVVFFWNTTVSIPEHLLMLAILAFTSLQLLWGLYSSMTVPDLTSLGAKEKAPLIKILSEREQRMSDSIGKRTNVWDFINPFLEGVVIYYGITFVYLNYFKNIKWFDITVAQYFNGVIVGIMYACVQRVIQVGLLGLIFRTQRRKLGIVIDEEPNS